MKKIYISGLGVILTLAAASQTGVIGKNSVLVVEKTCAAIQSTIDASATGTRIFLTDGDYMCNSNLTTRGKSIKLSGDKATRLVAQGAIGGLIYDYQSASSSIDISNITFDVNNVSNVSGISTGIVQNITLKNVKVVNCKDIWCIKIGDLGGKSEVTILNSTIGTSTNSTYEALLLMNAQNCIVRNNTFTNLTQAPAAFGLYVGSTNCIIRNNYFTHNTIRDFYSSGADHFLYDSNVSVASTSAIVSAHGVQIFNTKNAIFSNNRMTGQNDGSSAGGGFLIYDYAVGLDGHDTSAWATTSDITIKNNIINKSYVGISMNSVAGDDKHYDKPRITITGNTIIDPLWKAIDIGAGNVAQNMTDIEISYNKVQGVTKVFDAGNFTINGMSTSSIRNVVIKGNTGLKSSAGGSSSCVYVRGASNVTITANNCTGVNKGSYSPIQIDASTTANIIIN